MASFQWLGFSNQCNHSLRLSEIRAKKVISFRRYSVKCEERNRLGLEDERKDKKKLRLLIAGGGIGGLVLALAAKKRGYDVKVFEKDLSLVRGEGQHRGPIQLLSSALAVLEAIDEDVAKQIVDAGCVTGSRINGLADGLSGEWFTKYDLLTPAVSRGLPVTEVISRVTLQDILVNAVGMDIVSNTSKVVDFVQDSNKVKVVLEDGREHEGDVLVGADGIWSKVRAKLVGAQPANYSNYTCYSGYTSFVPPYIETVGYRVFLGLNKYFVASDVGSGKMQWYAFHKEAPMTNDPPGGKKERLLELFGNWCSEVVTLILETPEDMILKRDIYDRDMIYSWGNGRVTLLGDAAHPMQPNLGQGGCMAIEDCYQLIDELDKVPTSGSGAFLSTEIESALKRYEKERLVRVRIVHAATRIASRLLSYYEPYIYLGTGPLFGSSSWRFRHPGIHLARMIVQTFVPMYMSWMIAGHGVKPGIKGPFWQSFKDCYQLIDELDKVPTSGSGAFLSTEIESALKRYEKERLVRVRIVHAATRIASRLLSYYEPYIYLGTGPLFGSSSWRFRHPGIHLARMIVQTFVPMYMSWMIAGHGVKSGIKGPFWQSFKVLLLLLLLSVNI